ncbi:K+ channel tetramerization domain protein, partial [Teladorsagia circumcincta]
QQIAMVIPSTRKGHNNNNTLQPNHHNDEVSHLHVYAFEHKSENGGPRAELVSGAGDTVLKLNIGGMSFRIRMVSLFARTEEEKLVAFAQMDHEKRMRSCDAYIVDAEEYYFERSSVLFDAVFKYYATGQLHRPLDVCPQEFANELSYWKIPESVMSSCCWRGYNQLLQFLVGIMNIVDMVAIVPFYLELGLAMFGVDVASLSDIKGALLVVRVLRVLRVVRILKLGRYSSGMRTFALTLRSSARQLGMMGMVLSTGVVFFSTLLYFVEKDEVDTPFTSIPAAFWWAIVTMTTVGYGDYVPVTIPGKLIASGAIISGVLVLALPITIIVDNFMKPIAPCNWPPATQHHTPYN